MIAQISYSSDVVASSEHTGYEDQAKVFAKTKPVREQSKMHTRAVQAKSSFSDDP